jgi:hypothetical protein
MEKTYMKKIISIMAGIALLSVGGAALAEGNSEQAKNNWGQQVKTCNLTAPNGPCYGGGTRGEYVRVEAQDDQGPGYGWEIQTLANPGNSDPAFD